ncbi:MAG: phosphoribosylamine--glycine ligase [Spirochaetaceae bacterium]|jgi:phosphoribosylamine--glycine ligase|nr:phosphoribosylamine--glycine ligase [Spirochaetaceae bacterium]
MTNGKLKIAVIGSGGREHAIIRKLKASPGAASIEAIPGNGGIARDVRCVDIDPLDISAVVGHCRDAKIDYVVVTPDDPLALGMVDALGEAGIRAFGPVRSAARLESSKIFAKNLMKKYGIPTADYETFTESGAALAFAAKSFDSGKKALVVKADGLALGKGVSVCMSAEEARGAIRAAMDEKRFGKSGERIVIEEYLTGPEASVLSFCDGNTVVPMVSCMDHKRALDNDEGPNTGGMGCIAPNPFYTPEIAETCMKSIFIPTVEAVKKEAAAFRGCLYFGLMLTEAGPKVIEYNCRFGDPETQVVLPLLESDLLSLMLACTEGGLESRMARFKDGAAACVVAASGGYPASYKKGFRISGVEAAESSGGVEVYCAGVREEGGFLVTSGGRVLSVSAAAENIENALKAAYGGIEKISFEDMHFRTDIGKRALGVFNGLHGLHG